MTASREKDKTKTVVSSTKNQMVKTKSRFKRMPPRCHAVRSTDIFVSKRSSFPALTKRALSFLEPSATGRKQTSQKVTIHGLGAAIICAVQLALHIQKAASISISLSTTTSSVTLIDDVYKRSGVDSDTTGFNQSESVVCGNGEAKVSIDPNDNAAYNLDGADISLDQESRTNSAIHIVLSTL
ncbi:ribonucleases P/MRP protein subunit pop7 [Batrachochytrium dendrobatidis]